MKIIIITLALMTLPINVYSFGNLCEIASETPFMTSVKRKEFYDNNLRESSVRVRGKVTNVKPSIGDFVIVDITCGNQVEVSVRTDSFRAKDYKIGDFVSLSGTVHRYYKKRYVNTLNTYIHFYLRE